jgi:chromosomal replication initiation ATPase DnaA
MTPDLKTPRLDVHGGRLLFEVCHEFAVTSEGIKGRSRFADVVAARHTLFWLLRHHEKTCPSYAEIGRAFGMDHGSVIHGCERVDRDLANRTQPISRRLNAILTRVLPPLDYQI